MAHYGITETVDRPYDETVAAARAALATEGFGVITEIDVRATMKKKLDAEFRNYIILGACSPPSAMKVLTAEPEAGLFLPCNVIVYEKDDGKTVISAIDPLEMMKAIDNDDIKPVAKDIATRLRRAVEAVKAAS